MYNEHSKPFIRADDAFALLTNPALRKGDPALVFQTIKALNGHQIDLQDAIELNRKLAVAQARVAAEHMGPLNAVMKGQSSAHGDRLRGAMGVAKGGVYKAGGFIGTQLQGQDFNSDSPNLGSTFAPLVPQDISDKYRDVTADPEEAVLLNSLPVVRCNGLVHETALKLDTTRRAAQRAFLAEGGVGSTDVGFYERVALTLRCEYKQSDTSIPAAFASMIMQDGIVPKAGLEEDERRSYQAMLLKRASNVWWASASADPLAYNGFVNSQAGTTYSGGHMVMGNISATSRFGSNLANTDLTFDLVLDMLNEKNSPRNGQRVTIGKVLTHQRAIGYLQRQFQTYVQNVGNARITAYQNGFKIMPYVGPEVEILADPSISYYQRYEPIDATAVSGNFPGTPAISTAAAAANGSSQFVAADAGDYIYRIFSIGPQGESAQIVTSAVSVVAGDSVTIELLDNTGSLKGGTLGAVYYWVERSSVDAAVGTTEFIGLWPTNSLGASSGTRIIDDNLIRPGCAPVAFLASDKYGLNEWDSFIDIFRFPLGPVGASTPILYVSFGAPNWMAPQFNHLLLNAKFQ